jgi:hypothetical protein
MLNKNPQKAKINKTSGISFQGKKYDENRREISY